MKCCEIYCLLQQDLLKHSHFMFSSDTNTHYSSFDFSHLGFFTENHVYFVLARATGEMKHRQRPEKKNKKTVRTEFKLQGFDHELCHFHSQG